MCGCVEGEYRHFNITYVSTVNYVGTNWGCVGVWRVNIVTSTSHMGHGTRKPTDDDLGSRTPIFGNDVNHFGCQRRIMVQNTSAAKDCFHS